MVVRHSPSLPHFYPRSPRGERPYDRRGLIPLDEGFLSTLPARGATYQSRNRPIRKTISIHAPREGSDLEKRVMRPLLIISIHAPREGSDQPPPFGLDGVRQRISIHAPREGSDGRHDVR